MRQFALVLSGLTATFAFACFLAPAAQAGFHCASPTAVSFDDADKAASFVINQKISQNKWLGKQDGIMCDAPDGRGKFWHFKNGSVYWSPDTGAQTITGLIRDKWAEMGWEQGALAYPISDEINTYDGAAKVSKFQGGQLIWRSWTNQVTAVMTTDLLVDLPTPIGKSWQVVQANGIAQDDPKTKANEADSHQGTFAYCYDLVAANGSTVGEKFVSTADAKIVLADEEFDGPATANVVVQRLGAGRYASSLHIAKDSYSATTGDTTALNISTPWDKRLTAKSGDALAIVGNTGTEGVHIHYCITTSPDRSAYAPFESVPFAFRNYEQSSDNKKWTAVASGRPLRGTFVRRKAGGGAAKVTTSKQLLNYGKVSGSVTPPAGVQLVSGTIALTALAPWGEPVATKTIVLNAAGNASYTMTDIPDYPGMKIKAVFSGTSNPQKPLWGESAAFAVAANSAGTVNVVLKGLTMPGPMGPIKPKRPPTP